MKKALETMLAVFGSRRTDHVYPYIDDEDRGKVALELIGGITDELVVDLMDAVYREVPWPDGGEFDPEQAKANIRRVLAAIFGDAE